MRIFVNGDLKDIPRNATIGDLLAGFGLDPSTVVIEHNESVIEREAWQATSLSEGDKLEIVRFVGGGS